MPASPVPGARRRVQRCAATTVATIERLSLVRACPSDRLGGAVRRGQRGADGPAVGTSGRRDGGRVAGRRRAHARQPQDVLAELCDRLLACGLPLHRVAVFVTTLHPDVMGRRFLWRHGEGVLVTEAAYEHDGDQYLSAQPGSGRLRARRGDPAAARRPGLPGTTTRSWRNARRGRHRLPDPAAAVHQWRGARDQLDHPATERLQRRRHGRAGSDPAAASPASPRSTHCAGSRPRCSIPTSAATPASASCRAASGAATSSASTP